MYKKLLLLKKGIDVIRGTSKLKDFPSDASNKLNKNTREDISLKELKQKRTDKGRVEAAKSFAVTNTDPTATWGVKTVPKKDRLMLRGTLTARETAVGRRLFSRFAPKRNPFSSPSQRQGRLGRIIVPKSALKRLKVDRKLTREVRKENNGGIV